MSALLQQRYNSRRSLFTVSVGYLVDCLQVWRDRDFLNSSCCSLKLDNWTDELS